MSVHKKLMQARVKLLATDLKKSGRNTFQNYSYFELGDFIPHIQTIFNDIGLCGVVTFNNEYAQLCITDVDDGTVIVITSPMAEAALKGAQPIQLMGSIQTYQRRYLWMAAMELTEHDTIDMTPAPEPKQTPKPVVRAAPTPAEKPATPETMQGAPDYWSLKVTAKPTGDDKVWCGMVVDMSRMGLTQCGSEADVMSLFKVNRNIFAHFKVLDADLYEKLMAEFKKTSESFNEKA
jgi:hypothetical protein